MGRKLIDLTGMRFGKLVVQSYTGDKHHRWSCICDCGNVTLVQKAHLNSGNTKSCGCITIKHNMYGTPTYISWQNMLQRCLNPKNTNYHKYGALGVKICNEWNPKTGGSFENFLHDMGVRPDNHSINRIKSNLLYSKETCEWANANIQAYDQVVRKENTTGVAGVRWRKDRNVYESRISKDGKQLLLYYGPSLQDAINARIEAEKFYYPEIFNLCDTIKFDNIRKELEHGTN